MPIESSELLIELSARLPEIEWKISGLSPYFSYKSLPKGLFRTALGSNGSVYVAEIKADIVALSRQRSGRSAVYLAEQIRKKVNVLVALCRTHHQNKKSEAKNHFGLNMLSTRQQWITDLEAKVRSLEVQQQAMSKTLEHMLRGSNSAAILQLKAQLGELEHHLTLAQEELTRATS